MKIRLTVYSLFLFCSISFAQEAPSPKVITQLDNYSFQNKQDLIKYLQIIDAPENKLSFNAQIKYWQKALEPSVQLSADSLRLEILCYIMNNYIYDKAYDKAQLYIEDAKKMADKFQSDADWGFVESYSAIIYDGQAKFREALDHYNLAIKHFQKTENQQEICLLLTNISNVYKQIGQIHEAKKYLQKAIPYTIMSDSPERERSLAHIYKNIAEYFKKENQMDSSEYFIAKSIELIPAFDTIASSHFRYDAFNAYFFITRYYLEQGDIVNGKIYLDKASRYDEYSKLINLIKFDYCLKSQTCKNIKEQFQALLKNENSTESYPPEIKQDYYLKLKIAYYKYTEQYQKALQAQEAWYEIDNEFTNQEKVNYALFMNAQFENTEKTKTIKLLEKDNELKRTQIWLLSSGALIILATLFFTYYQVKQKIRFLTLDLENKKLIEQQAKELRKNVVLKNQLFGNIAHELRTPLSLIIGPTKQLLSEGQLMAKERQQVKIVADNSEELLLLTDQILDLIKSETGLIKLHLHSFILKELMNYLENQFQILANSRAIQLFFDKNIPADLVLISDVEKLITILKNLIANAIKYSATNGQISVSCTHNERKIQISVRDDGQGIPPEELNLIFDRYYQSDSNNTLEGGIGVGLAICREYSKLLGGRIEVESTVGVGSTFTVHIPIQPDELPASIPPYHFPVMEEAQNIELPRIGTKEIQEPYVLIVEDNLDLCQYLYSVLKDNYELSFAHNGQEALNQIAIQQPSLILTDWMMPVMDGKELIIHLKKQPALALIPILMLTARTNTKDQLSILRIGVDDYLTKPFEESSLQAHIIHLLELSAGRTKIESPTVESSEQAIDKTINLPVLEEKDQLFLTQFEDNVLQNISNFDLTLDFIGKKMEFSSRHLGRKVKELLGLTANQYIQEIRFREAKRMLVEGEYSSVKAVTYSIGFKSEKYFSRNFKKRFGKNPKEFLR